MPAGTDSTRTVTSGFVQPDKEDLIHATGTRTDSTRPPVVISSFPSLYVGAAVTSVRDFARFKAERRKISMATAYDSWSARLVGQSAIDAILVGDSVAMVVHGHPTTVSATVPMMALHTAAVAR